MFITIYKPDKEIYRFETDADAEQFLLRLREQYLVWSGYKNLYKLKQRLANYMQRPENEINQHYANRLERKYNRIKLDLSDRTHSLKVIIEK